jgi:hypothetical protein
MINRNEILMAIYEYGVACSLADPGDTEAALENTEAILSLINSNDVTYCHQCRLGLPGPPNNNEIHCQRIGQWRKPMSYCSEAIPK